MKKVLVTFVLALTTAALGQGSSPSQQPSAQPPAATDQQANTPTSQKTIKDPAEYNAYITALNTTDPAAKGQAMEAFVAQYPNSIVKVDALEQAMGAYQQAQNQAKVEDIAKRILQVNPNHINALAVVTFIDRSKATNGDANALKAVCDESQRGLQSLPSSQKPEAMSDQDFQKLRTQMSDIFEGAAGFCALQAKNFPVAKEHLTNALKVDPTNFGDTFQLGVADLSSTPMDLNGFFYCAKAINLARSQNNSAGANAVNNYCKAMHHNYHGNDQGWDQFVQQYGAQSAPPANIADVIKPKPTPCDIAVEAVRTNDVTQLSFDDRKFVLSQKGCSPAGTEAADKVWQSIQDLQKGGQAKLKIQVKVISATADSIQAAVTDEDQKDNKPDLQVTMEKPLTKPPAPGAIIDVIGVLTNYTPNPFMFTMEKGELPAAKAGAKTPAKKGAAGKKGATKKKK